MSLDAHHFIVYREAGRFAGWPANYGIWSWGDEIVVCFTVGHMDLTGQFHKRDRSRPFVTMQARSLDGGETWDVARMPCRTPGNRALSADEHQEPELHTAQVLDSENAPVTCSGDIDFTHPDFALMCARTGHTGGAVSWFYLSTDRCRSWDGPFSLPMFGLPGVAARTDCLVSGARELMLLLTAAQGEGRGGRTFCVGTSDGGGTFSPPSWIKAESEDQIIMPSSVQLDDGRILTAVRVHGAVRPPRFWIDLYCSDDDGVSWELLSQPVPSAGRAGNPPSMVRLQDGRLCLTYGYRDEPYGIRAVLSRDDGRTWSDPLVLRDDGGDADLGYTRTVQRTDGKVVTTYYTNNHTDGERYIGATVWSANEV